jgi:hypothetical protein
MSKAYLGPWMVSIIVLKSVIFCHPIRERKDVEMKYFHEDDTKPT